MLLYAAFNYTKNPDLVISDGKLTISSLKIVMKSKTVESYQDMNPLTV